MEKRRERNEESFIPDTGCEFAPKCLSCPHPYCIKYEEQAVKHEILEQRIREAAVMRSRGLTQREVASNFKVTIRTVQRWLDKAKDLSPRHSSLTQ